MRLHRTGNKMRLYSLTHSYRFSLSEAQETPSGMGRQPPKRHNGSLGSSQWALDMKVAAAQVAAEEEAKAKEEEESAAYALISALQAQTRELELQLEEAEEHKNQLSGANSNMSDQCSVNAQLVRRRTHQTPTSTELGGGKWC